jgi:hypothetical protein
MRRLLLAIGLVAAATSAHAEPPRNPLQPLDRSSPRATLETFFSSADALGDELANRYTVSQSRAEHGRLVALARQVIACLDLRHVPQASRLK